MGTMPAELRVRLSLVQLPPNKAGPGPASPCWAPEASWPWGPQEDVTAAACGVPLTPHMVASALGPTPISNGGSWGLVLLWSYCVARSLEAGVGAELCRAARLGPF